MRFLALALALAALPANATEYPLWDGEPIEEYARKIGLPPTKTIDLGNGVTMEFVLIPAGKFVMGTPQPQPVNEVYFQTQIWSGCIALSISGGVLLAMLAFVAARAVREKHRPQVSLRRLLLMALVGGAGLLGGLHWWYSKNAFTQANVEYQAALTRHNLANIAEMQAREVRISLPFYMGMYEVTNEQFNQVGSSPDVVFSPDTGGRAGLPVRGVMPIAAEDWCRRASAVSRKDLRLPSEAEWEYACRAGTHTAYCTGDDEASLNQVAWYALNSKGRPQPVGQKAPNAFGLYDMHGNVREYCTNPVQPRDQRASSDVPVWVHHIKQEGWYDWKDLVSFVKRGGSWASNAGAIRCADRGSIWPDSVSAADCGFRVVLLLFEPPEN